MGIVRIQVWVQPGARRSEVVGWEGEVLRVRVQAPPVEGRANKALVGLLAGALGLPKTNVAIEHGAGNRRKVVAVEGLEMAEVKQRLVTEAATGRSGPPSRRATGAG